MKSYPLIIALLFLTANVNAMECVYVPKQTSQGPYSGMSPQGDCGELSGDLLKLKPDHFDRLQFSLDNLATIIISDTRPVRVFYVSEKGRTVRAYFYDNGPDYFQEGLARTISKNKFGFINKKLEVVIPARYDHAFPFQNGHAVVCNGCTSEPFDKNCVHKEVTGGKWGLINRKGEEVIPIKFTREELLKQTAIRNGR